MIFCFVLYGLLKPQSNAKFLHKVAQSGRKTKPGWSFTLKGGRGPEM